MKSFTKESLSPQKAAGAQLDKDLRSHETSYSPFYRVDPAAGSLHDPVGLFFFAHHSTEIEKLRGSSPRTISAR